MINRIIKIALGAALIPFCIGYTWQLGEAFLSTAYKAESAYYFLAGCCIYLTIHVLFKKPLFAYVMGHELTHAFFAVLFGGSVKSFQASDRGGRVIVTKSNILITLAPYFFPIYAVASLMLYGFVRAADANQALINAIIVISGATFTFHVVLTFIFLNTDQNDIAEHGAFFSYPLIYLFNVAFVAIVMGVYLSSNLDYFVFFVNGIIKSVFLIKIIFIKAAELYQRI